MPSVLILRILRSLRLCPIQRPQFSSFWLWWRLSPLRLSLWRGGSGAVQVKFGAFGVTLHTVPWKRDTPLLFHITWGDFDWHIASAAEIFGSLSPILSVAEKVAFRYEESYQLPELYNDAIRRRWRELLRLFTNVNTIYVQDVLVRNVSRSLPSGDGEPPMEFLPNLEEIGYSGGSDARDAFTTFLNERQVAGHPVSLRLVDTSMFDEHPTLYLGGL